MPDWRGEIQRRLGASGMDPASESEVVTELAQTLEDRYAELRGEGLDEAAARDAVLHELREMPAITDSLPRSRRGRAVDGHDGPGGSMGSGRIAVDVVRDFRYAWRVMRKAPVLTVFAGLSLALGIGANTTVFTIINTLLLHPIPAAEPSRLVMVYESGAKESRQARNNLPLSYPNFEDLAKAQRCFGGMAGFTSGRPMLAGNGSNDRRFAEFVTPGYFETLGLTPALGRFFDQREQTRADAPPVVVMSYGVWRNRFGGKPEILGSTLQLNHVVFTVIGVAPKGFLGVSAIFGPDVWIPAASRLAFASEFGNAISDRGKTVFRTFARLQVKSPEQAQAALEPLSSALAAQYPATNQGRRVVVRPIGDELFSNVGGAASLAFSAAVLLAIVALILAIACSNVANLLLARAVTRRQEIAIRLAIGANRARLVRQMLTESVLLSLLSCAGGLAFGYAGCRFVWSFVPATVAPNMLTPRLDATVLLFAICVSLATAFVFGVAPAVRASRIDTAGALKEESRSAGRGRRAVSLGNALLVCQVAFSMLCLIVAALFFRSIQHAYAVDPGFQTSHLAMFLLDPRQAGYDEVRTNDFYREARRRVSALPGVASATWSSGPPFWNSAMRTIEIEGAEKRNKSDLLASVTFTVDTGFLQTMAIPLVAGRDFQETDRDTTVPVALINQALAGRDWPNGDPIGHRFQFAGDPVWRQVVGVVKNANYSSLGEAPQPCIYLPLQQNFAKSMYLYVRSQGDPDSLLPAVERELNRIDAKIEPAYVRTGQALVEQVLWGPNIGVALLGVFGSLALALASVGLYGVMAYSVGRRRGEIGLRTALGASPGAVVGLILREGMGLVAVGMAMGLAAGLAAGRLLSRMLFGISPSDPLSLAAAGGILLAVACFACYLPARAATRIDPMTALRDL